MAKLSEDTVKFLDENAKYLRNKNLLRNRLLVVAVFLGIPFLVFVLIGVAILIYALS